MRLGTTTLTAAANVPLIPAGSPNIYASMLVVQNNATHNVRMGDNTTSSTKGILLFATGSNTVNIAAPHGTLLNSYFLAGTNGDVIDWMYENSQ